MAGKVRPDRKKGRNVLILINWKSFSEYDQPHESQTNKDILETIVR